MVDNDQQFCLRWNNHQSTLISVFDSLLSNGILVDCTLAAEGKYLKAHKVVLTACSPYFESLLTQQFDKHPILILKDIKFQELKAMMDYMYRGEVNISQDQLSALLRAAESLQIKGLSDSHVFNDNDSLPHSKSSQQQQIHQHQQQQHHHQPQQQQQQQQQQRAHGLTIENKRSANMMLNNSNNNGALINRNDFSIESSVSRESSQSPTSRKRRKIRPLNKHSVNNMVLEEQGNQQNQNQNQTSSNDDRINIPNATIVATLSTSPNTTTATITTTTIHTNSSNTRNTSPVSSTAASSSLTNIPMGLTKTSSTLSNQDKDNSNDSVSLTISNSSNLVNRPLPQLHHVPPATASASTTSAPPVTITSSTSSLNQISTKTDTATDSHDNHSRKSISPDNDGLIEPKSECFDDGNDDDAPIMDYDDDDDEEYDSYDRPGPSFSNDGSYQGYSGWQHIERLDDGFQSGQDSSALSNREAQDKIKKPRVRRHVEAHLRFKCNLCFQSFTKMFLLNGHMQMYHNKIQDETDQTQFNIEIAEILPSEITLPVQDEEQLNKLTTFLSNEENFNTFAEKLALHNGNINEFVVFVMKRLISPKMAMQYSYKGYNKMKKFSDLKIMELLLHFKHKCDYCNRKFSKKHFMNLHMKRHNIDIEGLDEQRFRSLLDDVLPKGIKFPINNGVDFDRFDNFLSNQKHLDDIASKLVYFEDELNDFLLFSCKRLLNGDYAGYICSKGKYDKEKFIRSNVILLLHHTAKMSAKMQNASLRDVRGYVMIWLRNCRKTLLIRLQKQEAQELQMQSSKVDDVSQKS